MSIKLSGLIIAGGKSSRMGTDKAQLVFKNTSFLNHTISLLEFFTDDIVISSNQKPNVKYPVVSDQYQNIGPIGGLYCGLQAVKNDQVLVLPVDMPLLSQALLQYLLDQMDTNKKINIFHLNNRPQMLTGIYHKEILPYIYKQIRQKDYKLQHLLKHISHHLIDVSQFQNIFINFNSPEELNRLNSENEQ